MKKLIMAAMGICLASVVCAFGANYIADWTAVTPLSGDKIPIGRNKDGTDKAITVQGLRNSFKNMTGIQGNTWYSGLGAPSDSSLGRNGDFYLRIATHDVYLKSSGAWGSPILNIQGATGATGAAGRGISSVALTSGNHAAGTTDTYTITFTDSTTATFTVYNGANGSAGSGSFAWLNISTATQGRVVRQTQTVNGVAYGSGNIVIRDPGFPNYSSHDHATPIITSNMTSDTTWWQSVKSTLKTYFDTIYQTIMTAFSGTPAMNGVGSPGSSSAYARGDHVHPSDTSKQDAASAWTRTLQTNYSTARAAQQTGNMSRTTFTNMSTHIWAAIRAAGGGGGVSLTTSAGYPSTSDTTAATPGFANAAMRNYTAVYFTPTTLPVTSDQTDKLMTGATAQAWAIPWNNWSSSARSSASSVRSAINGAAIFTTYSCANGGYYKKLKSDGTAYCSTPTGTGGSMTYPGAGIAVSSGSAWGTSLTAPSGTIVGTSDSQALTNKTYNGNTLTAGTYTLTGTAGKTLTFSNTLTLSGTDSSTLNIGTGGTLGTAAYTAATAYATSTQGTTADNALARGGGTMTGNIAMGSSYKLTGLADGSSSGDSVKYIAASTATLGTSAIASGACATAVTVAGSGIATTDVIDWGFNADPTSTTGYAPSTSGMLTIIAYPTSGNANFKVCNNTAASITPSAVTLNWRVRR